MQQINIPEDNIDSEKITISKSFNYNQKKIQRNKIESNDDKSLNKLFDDEIEQLLEDEEDIELTTMDESLYYILLDELNNDINFSIISENRNLNLLTTIYNSIFSPSLQWHNIQNLLLDLCNFLLTQKVDLDQ